MSRPERISAPKPVAVSAVAAQMSQWTQPAPAKAPTEDLVNHSVRIPRGLRARFRAVVAREDGRTLQSVTEQMMERWLSEHE